jgi:NAD(P)-dependent dehydrogenase (short-subunit alcohol dehydrogenase family)
MATSLANSVALITAGSAGLGAATARAFAAMQMRVLINYSANSERANTLVKELSDISLASGINDIDEKRFIAIKADVSSRSDVARLVKTTVTEMGRLDVVFSNAGWTRLTDFNDLDANVDGEDWDRCFNMNVKSHLFLMHAAKEYLQASKGSFITTLSVAGVRLMGSSLVRPEISYDKGAN